MTVIKIILCIGVSFGISGICTPLLIPFLKRLKAGQSIREEGPKGHRIKAGTPTMGGLAIVLAVALSSVLFSPMNAELLSMLGAFFLFACIGFVDDFFKVVYKRNLGLTAKQKLILQLLIALALAVFQSSLSGWESSLYIPIAKTYIDLGVFFIPFVAFVVVSMVNAVNLTDGLDGLAAGVTAIVAACLSIIGYRFGFDSATIFSAAISGACIGFLIHNRYPAKLFMGDTGSLALGGGLAAASIFMNMELILPLIGGVYVAEAISVVIQVFVFKTQNERRFFRMAPLHHHFELGGWSESKVVRVFYTVTIILSFFALIVL
ncbi:MAG: phospho-N-acetylmuramoyl-pentapeptide-transferase [Clostridia bacterium]|nr:phospho-N-acetylmuramoyl-pentapeptide-transferase [Clostridia bacterium]